MPGKPVQDSKFQATGGSTHRFSITRFPEQGRNVIPTIFQPAGATLRRN